MVSPDSIKASTVVYLASFAALLGALAMGLALGYTAPALKKMENDLCPDYKCPYGQSKNSSILSDDKARREGQTGLIASMLAIGALIGGLLAEPSNEFLGRRLSLITCGIPFSLGWALIALAPNYTTVVCGRLLTGLCCGLVSCIAPSYVVEISPPNVRGMLGTCFQVMVTIGILLAAIFGRYMSYQGLAWISISAGAGMSLMMLRMNETPLWLLNKDRISEAKAQLECLRVGPIAEEFDMMCQVANQSRDLSANQYSWQTLKRREFTKPLILALALMFFQQFSGINAVLFYQEKIFEKAAPDSDVSLFTILVCFAQVIATIGGSLLVDRLGRRVLLISSGVGHSIALITFGWYSYMKTGDDKFSENYAWLALVSIVVFVISFSIGYGPIPWMMIPELSSTSVRSLITSIATFFNWVCVFFVTNYVEWLMNTIGDANAYYLFGAICATSCVFVVFVLPETKGRSNDQIQLELLGPGPARKASQGESTDLKVVA